MLSNVAGERAVCVHACVIGKERECEGSTTAVEFHSQAMQACTDDQRAVHTVPCNGTVYIYRSDVVEHSAVVVSSWGKAKAITRAIASEPVFW